MSVDKFKFVSPGVFIDEVDESGIPSLPERMGPLVIGRFKKGPGNRPVKVESYKDFARLFGDPAPGNASGDIWRTGELTAPTYAAYAVKAWLKNNSPCTVYRVLGEEASNADNTQAAKAGWITSGTFATPGDMSNPGGAYGLFVMPNPDSYPSAAAQGSITFTDSGSVGSVVTIISTDGTSVDYTSVATATDAANNNWNTGSSAADAATQLLSVITHSSGHGSKLAGNIVGDVLHLTQSVGGPLGNRAITEDEANATKADFTGGAHHPVTGTLAAIWYVEDGAVMLSGETRDGTAGITAAGTLMKSDAGMKFTAKVVKDGVTESDVTKVSTFNFDRNSDLFIRKVFNTDASNTNSDINSVSTNYWLGETFESNVRANENSKLAITGSTSADAGDYLGVILALDGTQDDTATDIEWADHQQAATAAQTGWFFSQDHRGETTSSFSPRSHTYNLFKFHALDSGAQANRDYKISITDIKVPTDNFNKFGSFSVELRRSTDIDNKPVILERFSGVNLDPTSANYIGRVVGDKHYTYDEDNKRIIEHGDNDNKSNFIRVKVSKLVEDGNAAGWNPFGVYGPAVPLTHELKHDTQATIIANGSGSANALPQATLQGSHPTNEMLFTSFDLTSSIAWPTSRMRVSSSEGSLVQGTSAYFGYQSNIKDSRRFDMTNLDLHRCAPQAFDQTAVDANDTLRQYSWVFTLDDVKVNPSDSNHAVWVEGSRASGDSYTAGGTSATVLSAGYNKFTSPMFGGCDGYDITEKDPFRNSKMGSSPTEINNSAYYSLKKAIDVCSDADFIEYDVLTAPGITVDSLNTQMINACEDRADALAIVDIRGGYQPSHERSESETDTSILGSVDTTVTNLQSMNINSSYACTFYPWVKIRDTSSDALLYVPPSVVALGTLSSAQRKSAVWFAPAGFTRGGLSEGSAGIPVLGVRQRLTSAERDKLYDANINPIASFPAEGLVIFGQKTLQVTPSALDRINVRRLMIYVKKEISRIASRVLFDQNVQSTWDRFTGQVIPFLEGVQAGLGLTDFKVVLDDSTTTPDLVDRNILYAKIFLKPARAIEFIALDFIITRSGASFED